MKILFFLAFIFFTYMILVFLTLEINIYDWHWVARLFLLIGIAKAYESVSKE